MSDLRLIATLWRLAAILGWILLAASVIGRFVEPCI